MFNVKVIEDFLSKEDCDHLIKSAISLDMWESGGGEFWDGRVLNYGKVLKHDKDTANMMLDINLRCKAIIEKEMLESENIYSDTLQVIRWFPGMEQPTHADDMSNTDVQGFSHRSFGSILYLNDGYSGGHTYYPNLNFEITPKAGALAIHPGDEEHLHGVTKIDGGMRYTVASFWTKERDKGYDWSIYQ
jgi:prolyl 4-hydroxylase